MIIHKKIYDFISYSRFPLLLMIVFIHSRFLPEPSIESFPIYASISFFVSEIVSRIAVPWYFIFSGWLFFKNCESSYDFHDYVGKLKKRTKSLLIPYVFWNLLTLVVSLGWSSINGGGIRESFWAWIVSFWDRGDGMPICFQFWYVRDLMMLVVISPLFYYIISKRITCIIALIASGVWWLLGKDNINGYLNSSSVFFFYVGSLMAVCPSEIEKLTKNIKFKLKIVMILASLLSLTIMIAYNRGTWFEIYPIFLRQIVYHVCVVLFMVAFFCLLFEKNNKGVVDRRYSISSQEQFFIYGCHVLLVKIIILIYSRYIPISDIGCVMLYVAMPLITICIGTLVYRIINKISPKTTKVIVGGR